MSPLLCIWGEGKRVRRQRLGHFKEFLPSLMSVPKSKGWVLAAVGHKAPCPYPDPIRII